MNAAYDEDYVMLTQRVMGDMLDYAANTLEYDLIFFYKLFLVSSVSKQIEIGNPAYVAGKNGCELARMVIEEVYNREFWREDIMYTDKTPEYWIGWTLAYYQWNTGKSFKEIDSVIPISDMYGMYDTMHEADISKFINVADERFGNNMKANMLKRLRMYAGLSQSKLAEKAGIAVRQIQMFEQGQRDIRKSQADTLQSLSRVLNCEIEDLLKLN